MLVIDQELLYLCFDFQERKGRKNPQKARERFLCVRARIHSRRWKAIQTIYANRLSANGASSSYNSSSSSTSSLFCLQTLKGILLDEISLLQWLLAYLQLAIQSDASFPTFDFGN